MIDERTLQTLLGEVAHDIPVPADGPDRVLDALTGVAAKSNRRQRSGLPTGLFAVAAAVVCGVVVVSLLGGTSTSSKSSSSAPVSTPAGGPPSGSGSDQFSVAAGTPAASGVAGARTAHGTTPSAPPTGTAPAPTAPATRPADAAKIVKTGTLDLQVAHGTLHTAVNRVTATAVGLGGYVSASQTSYGGTDPTAQITIRVPVAAFETAVTRLDALPGVTVLNDSESGSDVTGQYTDLQAQLAAATGERDALLVVLSHAQSIGDILAVRDRVTAAQAEVDQLQGRINVLGDQAAFSSLAVALSEKAARTPTAVVHHPSQSGLAKSWSDARRGFADVLEWLLARSGAALIILLAAIALLYGVRYLYPIVRRGLV